MAAAMAETGDSFSSSDVCRMWCPSLNPASMESTTKITVAKKITQTDTVPMLIQNSSAAYRVAVFSTLARTAIVNPMLLSHPCL